MATGTITIINKGGKSGNFKVVSIDSSKDVCSGEECIGKEILYVDPKGDSGVIVGGPAVGQIVEAGASGVYIIINIQPTA
ncbi:MAG: hypothetical protein ACXVC6_13480 [Bacteroidia bacterium]